MNRKKVLITGATGFIGSYLVETLLAADQFDIVVAGRRRPESAQNDQVTFFQTGSISASTDWKHGLAGVEAVFHLAGLAHVSGAQDAFEEVNVRGTTNLARQSAQAGVKHFLFLSSIGVNGNTTPADQPFVASDKPHPREPYAVSKLNAEVELKALCTGSSMAYTVVRPPLVYGPQAPGNFGLLSSIVGKGLPLPLAGIPNSRSFVSVWNLADLLLRCVVKDRAKGETLLVRDGLDVSTSQFLEMIGEASGQKVRLFRVPHSLLKLGASLIGKQRMYDKLFDSLLVDDAHTRKVLDWQPPFTLQESLRKCFQHDPSI